MVYPRRLDIVPSGLLKVVLFCLFFSLDGAVLGTSNKMIFLVDVVEITGMAILHELLFIVLRIFKQHVGHDGPSTASCNLVDMLCFTADDMVLKDVFIDMTGDV